MEFTQNKYVNSVKSILQKKLLPEPEMDNIYSIYNTYLMLKLKIHVGPI